jgi:hypothetical protein
MENRLDRIDAVRREAAFAPGARAAGSSGRAFIVGITIDGSVPLTEDLEPSIAGMSGSATLDLPSIPYDVAPFDASPELVNARLSARLAAEIGYEAREFVSMRSDFAGGDLPGWPFLLAPLLRPTGWRARVGFVPGVREIPLRDMRRYLLRRAREGAAVRPEVYQGLVLAEEFFPQWACRRLGQAIEVVEARRARNPACASA